MSESEFDQENIANTEGLLEMDLCNISPQQQFDNWMIIYLEVQIDL